MHIHTPLMGRPCSSVMYVMIIVFLVRLSEVWVLGSRFAGFRVGGRSGSEWLKESRWFSYDVGAGGFY